MQRPRAFTRRRYPGRTPVARLLIEHESLSAELQLAARPSARIRWLVYTLHDIELELETHGAMPRRPWFPQHPPEVVSRVHDPR